MVEPGEPAFEVVHIEDASNERAKRLRVYVAVRPEDAALMAQVAVAVVTDHAANNDVVTIFFHYSADVAGRTPAEGRAQYVRAGLRQGFVPAPLTSDRRMVKMKMPHGVLTLEPARPAS
jgi:hypothetical protein